MNAFYTEKIHIYEIPDEEKNSSFQIYEVKGKKIQNPIYPYKTNRPHRHNYYEICVFDNGAGQHDIDFTSFRIKPKSIHFLSPGQVHLISREEDYHGYLLVFTRDFYSWDLQKKDLLFDLPFFNNNNAKPILELNDNEFEEFISIIENILKEKASVLKSKTEIIRAYLHIFLLKCKEEFISKQENFVSIENISAKTVNHFKLLLEESFRELHFVKEYADMLSISPIRLNKLVKEMTGKNASDLIIDRIVLEAKRLLSYTELSTKEIGFQMNYDDPSYFCRVFRKETGITPTEFRKNLKEKYQ